jgi:hypothetical protein
MKRVTRDASAVQEALVRAQAEADNVSGETGSALHDALRAHLALTQALQKLPSDPVDLSSNDVQRVSSQASAAENAYRRVESLVPSAPHMSNDVGDIHQLSQLASEAESQRELGSFLQKVGGILTQSANGRAQIISTISRVLDHCSTPPDRAAEEISSVADNRQSVLDQVSAMTVPDDPDAQRVASLLQESLQHSIEADRHFADWMNFLFRYYYTFPIGCPGQVPTNNAYDQAESESHSADSAKEQLVRVYDPLAKQFGLRSDWKAGDI